MPISSSVFPCRRSASISARRSRNFSYRLVALIAGLNHKKRLDASLDKKIVCLYITPIDNVPEQQMTITYTITEGQLVRLNEDRPEDAIDCATVFELLASLQLRNMTVAEFIAETAE